jgi:hypothetical protein
LAVLRDERRRVSGKASSSRPRLLGVDLGPLGVFANAGGFGVRDPRVFGVFGVRDPRVFGVFGRAGVFAAMVFRGRFVGLESGRSSRSGDGEGSGDGEESVGLRALRDGVGVIGSVRAREAGGAGTVGSSRPPSTGLTGDGSRSCVGPAPARARCSSKVPAAVAIGSDGLIGKAGPAGRVLMAWFTVGGPAG